MLYCFKPANDREVVYVSHNYHIQPEFHPSRILKVHDIFYVIDGYCSVRLEGEELQINPGEIAILPARHPHYRSQLYRANTHTIFVHFCAHEEDHILLKDEIPGEDSILLPGKIYARNPVLLQYFQDLEKIYWSAMSHRERRCSAIMGLLLMEMHDCYKNEGIRQDELMINLLGLISGHPEKFYSIQELADQFNLSPKSLTSRFKAETGQALHQYQLNKKLDQAASLLRSESYVNLKSLADNFGFYDEFHLSAAFKKKFGISPDQFRKNLSYTFDPSVGGSQNQFPATLKNSSILHIINDNVSFVFAKKFGGHTVRRITKILLCFRETKGLDCKVELVISFTANTAWLTSQSGLERIGDCVLSADGREIAFPIKAWETINLALELPETAILPI
ncbi:hypothetical protein FACS1894147_09090 [Spirochaetia bacterium]|nr:hypothetical protein FACS1894147_09090 [Spirochaetia bacterium]